MGGIDERLQNLSLEENEETLSLKIRDIRLKIEEARSKRRRVRDLHDRQTRLRTNLAEQLNEEEGRQEEALLEFKSTVSRRKAAESALSRCQQWNVMNDCFHIWHHGPFATINGLRLGAEAPPLESAEEGTEAVPTSPNRKGAPRFLGFSNDLRTNDPKTPPQPIRVPWNEINAALGQVALLLATLEGKAHAGIKFSHEIVPLGSTSKIGVRRGESVAYYNLFSDDGFQFFGKRNFNTALHCLVDCVVEAALAIEKRDRTISMPHIIGKNARAECTIGGLSIAYGADGVEWTRAMKYLLTDIKHLMVFRVFGLWEELGAAS